MERYQVNLAYDGTHFQGFQRQGGGNRTVQAEVESALCQLGWQGQSVLAAGRTDTGVHAAGQVIAFDLNWDHTPAELCRALNAHLPADVAARSARLAAAGFHPRYDALARTYCYRLFCDPVRNPLLERYAWRVWPIVDLQVLEQAAGMLVGTHDFSAFGTPHKPGGSTVRQIFSASWQAVGLQPEALTFTVTGNAFLYHMVRRMVFTQVRVGLGQIRAEEFMAGVNEARELPPGLAPPNGLTLVQVHYEDQDNRTITPRAARGQTEGSPSGVTELASGEHDCGKDLCH